MIFTRFVHSTLPPYYSMIFNSCQFLGKPDIHGSAESHNLGVVFPPQPLFMGE